MNCSHINAELTGGWTDGWTGNSDFIRPSVEQGPKDTRKLIFWKIVHVFKVNNKIPEWRVFANFEHDTLFRTLQKQ